MTAMILGEKFELRRNQPAAAGIPAASQAVIPAAAILGEVIPVGVILAVAIPVEVIPAVEEGVGEIGGRIFKTIPKCSR
jgi:hypothetical protein